MNISNKPNNIHIPYRVEDMTYWSAQPNVILLPSHPRGSSTNQATMNEVFVRL
jgi:hypothetical protein